MKILFINPSLRPDAGSGKEGSGTYKQFPVGLGYIVTYVKKAGYDFDILDVDIGSLSDEEVETYLRENLYDIIAFGCISTHYKWSKWLIHTAKRHQPDCTVIVGNSVGESMPEILFANSPVDIVVKGEGEVTTVELLNALRDKQPLGEAIEPIEELPNPNGGPYQSLVKGEGIEGLVFRDDRGRLVSTGLRKVTLHIDDYGTPDWDLFDVEEYFKSTSTNTRGHTTLFPKEEAIVMPISTARGCVFKCTFCHYTQWNDPYRHRSAEQIVEEIRFHKEKYGANYFNFWDDLSFHKLGPAEKFLDVLIEADLKIHFTASCRADLFGRSEIPLEDRLRVAQKFRDAGCIVLNYSLESANAEILGAMNKRINKDYFRETVKILREIGGIVTMTSLVLGYPQETAETIQESMQLCYELQIYPSCGFLLPLPATEMWRYCIENGHITDPDAFLMDVTERQDIILNITKMTDEGLYQEVVDGLTLLSEALDLGLKGGSLIRTGGMTRHGKNQDKLAEKDAKQLVTANLQADHVPELNYSKMEGGM